MRKHYIDYSDVNLDRGGTNMWYVYMLVNSRDRTYIGSTTNPPRRLRQHNGEIVGGARSTRKYRPWRLFVVLAGFPNRSSACRWEKLLKLRCRGLVGRYAGFRLVSIGICPTKHSKQKQYLVPEDLTIIHYGGDSNA